MHLIDVDIVILQDLSVVDFQAILAIAPFGNDDVVVEAACLNCLPQHGCMVKVQ